MEPGTQSFDELVASMDKGVIVFGALGAHSGNIPNGDFSIGINPGLYVENGKIVGRVNDAMVAGNVYDVMKNVVAVGNEAVPSNMITTPPVLIADMNVAIKG